MHPFARASLGHFTATWSIEPHAMGGDPFFLENHEAEAVEDDEASAVWEWDGIVDDEAHMD